MVEILDFIAAIMATSIGSTTVKVLDAILDDF